MSLYTTWGYDHSTAAIGTRTVTGESTRCTFDSSSKISLAFWHSNLTSVSGVGMGGMRSRLCESPVSVEKGAKPRIVGAQQEETYR